ncbi:PREDICTED: beta,beta-carotene 15,15'-monooxygenase [Condylura cristata]|uniref:beta,beta-carotene 15,15'-monooxygenase n=1 Tax=Condylura cristata TaxID=143302 RepID=UPI0003343196|nr:PREDICTED: beta,beta-carotene 15,15'-monooxygenase [Condylura cristata]
MDVLFGKNMKEYKEAVTAEVRGNIPSWLQGRLLRNGPGMHTVGETRYNHWFDGLALLHCFVIKSGNVYYFNRYLESNTYNANIKANKIVVSEFGTMVYPDPNANIFSKAFSYLSHMIPDFTDNCLINVMKCGKYYYALTETNYIWKINLLDLMVCEKIDYRKHVGVNVATAHPHYDEAGNVINIGTSIMNKGKTKYVIFKVPATVPAGKRKNCWKHAEVLCSITSRSLLSPSYYHSFGVTENYIIFLEQPFKLDIVKMATAYARGVSWASCLTFHKDDKTYIHIIDQRTRKPVQTKFYTGPLVVFHHVNAYEEDGCILFDVVSYEDSSLYDFFYLDNLTQKFQDNVKPNSIPTLKRFAVPLHVDKDAEKGSNLIKLASTKAEARKEEDDQVYCQPEVLHEGMEMPQINYAYNGKPYRYVFATEVKWNLIPSKIIKYDLLTKSFMEWGEEHCWLGEPVFVAKPDAKDEDDGIILSVVISTIPQRHPFLLILDAKSFTELARASFDIEMCPDLHGFFIPALDCEAELEHPPVEELEQASLDDAASRS